MKKPEDMQISAFTPEELARRRANGRRMAWGLAIFVIALYTIGMFIQR